MANLQVWGQAPRRAAGTQRLWRAQGRQEGPQGWEGPQGQEAPHHLPPSPPLSPEHAGGLAAAQGLPPAQGELSPSAQAGCEVPRRCQQHTRAPSWPCRAGSTRSRRGSGFACGGRGRNFANPITSLPSSLTEHGIDFPHWVYLDCLFCEKAKLGRLTVAPGLMRKPCQRRQRFPRLAPCRPVIGHSAQCRLRICPAHSLHSLHSLHTAFTQPAQLGSLWLESPLTPRLRLERVAAPSRSAQGDALGDLAGKLAFQAIQSCRTGSLH